MKPRLYLETTIPSYLVARRSRDLRLAADQETTQQWWESERQGFLLFISTTVLKEVRRGDPTHAAAREAWLAGIPLLGDLPEANELAKRLLRDEIIPAVAADDATHVALAAAHQMDFLLTWNCKHINNHNIRTRIQRACEAVGLVCPDICTPAELMKL
jgi:hypothetical protein